MQLVDSILVSNWDQAALALSLMQSVVFDCKLRISKLMGQGGDTILQAVARGAPDANMTVIRDAGLTPASSVTGHGDDCGAGAGAGAGDGGLLQERPTPHSAAQALVAEDVSALAVAGVSGAALMAPRRMPVMVDADAVSNQTSLGSCVGASASTSADVQPLVRTTWACATCRTCPCTVLGCLTCLLHTQAFSRVYRGVWKRPSSDGTIQAVVVKVLSPLQAKREMTVLSALAPHPSARAVRMHSTVCVGMDTGIITPYCPGRLFLGCSVKAVLEQVMQLCKVGLVHELSACCVLTVVRVVVQYAQAVDGWHSRGVLHLDIKPSNMWPSMPSAPWLCLTLARRGSPPMGSALSLLQLARRVSLRPSLRNLVREWRRRLVMSTVSVSLSARQYMVGCPKLPPQQL